MVNILLLEIGDEVFVNENKGGKIVGFHKIVLSEGSCFRTGDCLPGIYRDPALAQVRMENSKVVDVYYNCLEVVDSREYIKRKKTTGYCGGKIIRRFPETLFCEGDKAQVKLESFEKIRNLVGEVIEGYSHRKPQMLCLGIDIGKEPEFDLDIFFVVSVNYLSNGHCTYNISDKPDNSHWHITVEEKDLRLLKHGEIWKVYHKK